MVYNSQVEFVIRVNHPFDLPIHTLVKQKRKEDRDLCADLVKVQWKTEAGRLCSEWAILGDISPSGACLEMEGPIPPDTLVSLDFRKDRCEARVRYCTFDKMNYLLGVKFEQGYRWSRRRFKPNHLIQFRLHGVKKTG